MLLGYKMYCIWNESHLFYMTVSKLIASFTTKVKTAVLETCGNKVVIPKLIYL